MNTKNATNFAAHILRKLARKYYRKSDLPPGFLVRVTKIKELGYVEFGNKQKIKAGSKKHKHAPCIRFAKWTRRAPRIMHGTAIHEIAHLHLWWKYEYLGHGRRFNKEMLRLAKLGAQNGVW